MPANVKQIFSLGNRVYELVVIEGPIVRENRRFPAQFDHGAGVLRISSTVPVEQRAWVAAVAVSDACLRLWKPIPLIFPNWIPDRRDDPPAGGSPRPGPADDRPDR
jgi:hypothetical protein